MIPHYIYPGLKFKSEVRGMIVPCPSGEDIMKYVAKYYKVRIDFFQCKIRTKDRVFLRQLCMYLMRNISGLTLVASGSYFGMDHKSVKGALASIEQYIKSDRKVKLQIDCIINKLQ